MERIEKIMVGKIGLDGPIRGWLIVFAVIIAVVAVIMWICVR